MAHYIFKDKSNGRYAMSDGYYNPNTTKDISRAFVSTNKNSGCLLSSRYEAIPVQVFIGRPLPTKVPK